MNNNTNIYTKYILANYHKQDKIEFNEYMNVKKINLLLYSENLKEILEVEQYKKIDLKYLYKVILKMNNDKIIDNENKKNIYEIVNYLRNNRLSENDTETINNIIRITNLASDENCQNFYSQQCMNRYNECPRNIKNLEVENIRKSIAADYYFMDIILNPNYDDETFKLNLVQYCLLQIYFIYSMTALLNENPMIIDTKAKDRIKYIINNSNKLSFFKKTELYIREDIDDTSLNFKINNNKLKIKLINFKGDMKNEK